ncbi:MAG: BCCT family transporter [Treponema sp.]|jgi:BCCT family betaine/carnitine transporter|nr:BCCT family transporter [Treponema sp.]
MNENLQKNSKWAKGGAAINIDMLLFPLLLVLAMALLIYFFPEGAAGVIGMLNSILVNQGGVFYIVTGVFMLGCSIYIAASKWGAIKLGAREKPAYSNFRWGAMIFTSTMAADILYWSLIEWVYYFQADPAGEGGLSLASHARIASAYPLFHWGPIPWAFYILPAAAYAYMFYVKARGRSALSEACRPILGKKTDGALGRVIDTVAIVGFIGGTATTFATATPLIAESINALFGTALGKSLTVIILLVVGLVFTTAVLIGMKAIANLAVFNVAAFAILLAAIFFMGPSKFIIESGVSGIGTMLNNFVSMATWMDPLRATGEGGGAAGFPQQWTVFYWAYWIAWFVATPFFIAKISEGRTIRGMIFGAYFYGIAGTFLSFIVFGNFGLYQQVSGKVDTVGMLDAGSAPAQIIVEFFRQLPLVKPVLCLLAIVMIAFYASTFDAITLVISGFCKKNGLEDHRDTKLRIYWALVLIILPISLIWSESTLSSLQTVSIIAAFPLALIMYLIVFSFLKELRGRVGSRG